MSIASWKSLANNLFNSFGDVVRDASVKKVSKSIYNPNTAAYDEVVTSISTKAVPCKPTRSFISRQSYQQENAFYFMIRGSDFLVPPDVEDVLVFETVEYTIKMVETDSARVGAYYKLYACPR